MAEGFLRSFDPRLEVYSAGSAPTSQVNPNAIRVMGETGVDLSTARPRNVGEVLCDPFAYVITVCANAERECPAFTGQVRHRLHIGFSDPADAAGTDEEVLAVFRKSRDEIHRRFHEFYTQELKPQLDNTGEPS